MTELGLLQAEPDYDDLIRTEYQPRLTQFRPLCAGWG